MIEELKRYLNQYHFFLVVAGLVGLLSGIAAVTLKFVVHFTHILLLRDEGLVTLAYPLLGVLVTVLITNFVLHDRLGHDITQILYSITKNSGLLKMKLVYSRMLTSLFTVGFGGSAGLEAPIVTTGSAIGSNISRFFLMDYKHRLLLIGCGSAGAISGIFNSPIAGVIFAIEVILTDITINKFIPILLASVMGQLASMTLVGSEIMFSFKIVDVFEVSDTPHYILLGIFCGFLSLYFIRALTRTEGLLKKINSPFQRAVSGMLVFTVLLLILPQVYGEGYDIITTLLNEGSIGGFRFPTSPQAISGLLPLALTAMIILAKPIATGLTIGSGGSGGVFAPSMFMGAVTGFFFATLINTLVPSTGLSLSNFILVGMCGLLSGVIHAPLTAIFLIAEITGGYFLFLPLMLVSALSFTTVSYFEKHSIYTKGLVDAGNHLPYDRDQTVLGMIQIHQILEKDLLTIHPEATLGDLVQLVQKSKRNLFPVVDEHGELQGIITLDTIREIMFDNHEHDRKIRSLMSNAPAEVSVGDPMSDVINKFEGTQAWNLPVLKDGKYYGLISKSRIFNAYRDNLIERSKE